MSELIISFGAAVRQLRERLGWSQEQLAERADLNRSYVGEIERGQVIASLLTIQKLAGALGVLASDLISQSEQLQNAQQVTSIRLTAIAC
jgi:transcriptional regulator with XRE-family HTH domain